MLIKYILLGNTLVKIFIKNSLPKKYTAPKSQRRRHPSLRPLPVLGHPFLPSPKKCQMFITQHIWVIITPTLAPVHIPVTECGKLEPKCLILTGLFYLPRDHDYVEIA